MTGVCGMMLGAAGGDPYFANRKLLLHMDGADASTTFTDQNGHAFTANGNARISTAQSKYGGASGLFDGTGDWIETPDSADFTLGSGDFVCEYWMRTSSANTYIYGQSDSSITGSSISIYGYITAGGKVRSGCYVGGTAKSVDSTTTVTTGAWFFISQVVSGGTMKLYVNGVSEGTPIALGGAVNDSANKFSIGRLGEYAGTPFNGNIDDFRLTVGVPRYTGNFTPPTAAFPDS